MAIFIEGVSAPPSLGGHNPHAGLGVLLPAALTARALRRGRLGKKLRGRIQAKREEKGKSALTAARARQMNVLAARVAAIKDDAKQQKRYNRVLKRLSPDEKSAFIAAFNKLQGKGDTTTATKSSAQAAKIMRLPTQKLVRGTRALKAKLDVQADEATAAVKTAKSQPERRAKSAAAVALRLRRRRTMIAKLFADRAAKSKDSGEAERLKRASVIALKAPMKAQRGKIMLDCPTAQMRGLGWLLSGSGLGYFPGAAYDQGNVVPQMTDGHTMEPSADMLRRAITSSGMPAGSNWPGAVQVPNFVSLSPAVMAAGRVEVPPNLRPPSPPRDIRVVVPPVPPRQGPRIVVPAAKQHPSQRGPVLPRPGPASLLPQNMPPSTPQARAVPEMGPSEADMGWLGKALVEDVAGVFGDIVLATEMTADGILAGFGAPRPDKRPGPPGKRGPPGPELPYEHRLEGHILRTQRGMSEQIVSMARGVGIAAKELEPIVKELGRHHAEREGQLAGKIGRVPQSAAIAKRRKALQRKLMQAAPRRCR